MNTDYKIYSLDYLPIFEQHDAFRKADMLI
jgi:hypothetical protein